MAPTEYIPAWRRIGLKLKSEEKAVNGFAQPSNHTQESASKKRSLSKAFERESRINDKTSTKKFKEQKSRKNGLSTVAEVDSSSNTLVNDGGTPVSNSLNGHQTSAPRRKSVTFSSDTKTSDGDSAKSLPAQIQASRLARSSGVEEADIETAAKELESIPAALSTPKRKKAKKPKKPKSEKDPKSSSTNGTNSDPASPSTLWPSKDADLDYLTAYHTAHSTWKFKKTRQVKLFKHIFDTTLMPLSYDDALHAYIVSVQGDSIRDKLLDDAEEVIRRGGRENTKEEREREGEGDGQGENKEEGKEVRKDGTEQEGEEERNKRLDRIRRAETVSKAIRESFEQFPRKTPESVVKMDKEEVDGREETRDTEWPPEGVRDQRARKTGKKRKKKHVTTRRTRPRLRHPRTDNRNDNSSSSGENSSSSENEDEDEDGGKGVQLIIGNKASYANGIPRRTKAQDESSSSSSSSDSDNKSGQRNRRRISHL